MIHSAREHLGVKFNVFIMDPACGDLLEIPLYDLIAGDRVCLCVTEYTHIGTTVEIKGNIGVHQKMHIVGLAF